MGPKMWKICVISVLIKYDRRDLLCNGLVDAKTSQLLLAHWLTPIISKPGDEKVASQPCSQAPKNTGTNNHKNAEYQTHKSVYPYIFVN